MKNILDSPNAEFLFARIHAQWSRALTPARILDLLASPATGAIEAALKAAGAGNSADPGAPRALTLRFVRELADVRSLLNPSLGLFYSSFLDRLYLDNLRLLLRIRHTPARRDELAALLLDAPELPPLHPDPLLQADSAVHMHALLPPSPFHRNLLPILREWDAGRDLFVAECRLDTLAHTTLMAAAEGLDDEFRTLAVRLSGIELDIAHILLLLRNLATYRLPPEQVDSLGYGDGYKIRQDNFPALARQPDAESLLRLLPPPYAPIVRKAGSDNPTAVEDALAAFHVYQANDAFRDYGHPALTIVSYPFLKRNELRNAIRLAEGHRLGLKPDDIRKLVIGADDV